MNAQLGRRKALAAGLGIISLLWTGDMLLGPDPQSAQAVGGGVAGKPVVLPSEPADRARIEAGLLSGAAEIQPLDLSQFKRDPFVATTKLPAATGILAPPAAVPASAPTDVPPATEPTWVIQGVVLGKRPFAVINGQICSKGDEIEGHRVESIERDVVTLSRAGRRTQLRVAAPKAGGD
jgi:hypothetical protein